MAVLREFHRRITDAPSGVPILPGCSGIRQNSNMPPRVGTPASSATAAFAGISWPPPPARTGLTSTPPRKVSISRAPISSFCRRSSHRHTSQQFRSPASLAKSLLAVPENAVRCSATVTRGVNARDGLCLAAGHGAVVPRRGGSVVRRARRRRQFPTTRREARCSSRKPQAGHGPKCVARDDKPRATRR
jgi:hypothetical protein